MAFVETIESSPAEAAAKSEASPASSTQPSGSPASSPAGTSSEEEKAGTQPDATAEDKKKFVKKY
jgi:hypothetical protein